MLIACMVGEPKARLLIQDHLRQILGNVAKLVAKLDTVVHVGAAVISLGCREGRLEVGFRVQRLEQVVWLDEIV